MSTDRNLAERSSEALGVAPSQGRPFLGDSSLNLAGASASALSGKRVIHRGHGQILIVDDVKRPEPCAQPKPKAYGGSRPAKAESLRLKFNVQRVPGLATPRRHTGYKPGPITDMGHDQCRFIPGDFTCCGAKTVRGFYCAQHASIVFTKGV